MVGVFDIPQKNITCVAYNASSPGGELYVLYDTDMSVNVNGLFGTLWTMFHTGPAILTLMRPLAYA